VGQKHRVSNRCRFRLPDAACVGASGEQPDIGVVKVRNNGTQEAARKKSSSKINYRSQSKAFDNTPAQPFRPARSILEDSHSSDARDL